MKNQVIELPKLHVPSTKVPTFEEEQDILILKNVERSLNSVPYHHSVSGIKRYYCDGFPYHMAIHQIAKNSSNEFSAEDHNHHADEVNILISEDELVMEYEINGKRFIAEAPCSVLIKKNRYHKSRIVRGKGIFICLILTDTQSAYQK